MDDFKEMSVGCEGRGLYTIFEGLKFFYFVCVDLMRGIDLFRGNALGLFVFWLFFGLFIVFVIIVIILLVDQAVANNVESVHDLFHFLIELTCWIIVIIRVGPLTPTKTSVVLFI